MEPFETFISRHGEVAVQAILENWERFQGIQYLTFTTLEQRWTRFMCETSSAPARSAA